MDASPDSDHGYLDDEESRTAMRAFLQRAEVRLSTIHRVGQALIGGSALVLLLPLFLRDAFPNMMTMLIAGYDADQNVVPFAALGVASTLVILLPVPVIFVLVGDLLAFYFTSNTFGAHPTADGEPRGVFNPRFAIPGLGFNNNEMSPATERELAAERADPWTRGILLPKSQNDRGWRDRFDTRSYEVWGSLAPHGPDGDSERVRQSFRLAGLHRNRTLASDVARTEALVARHVLAIRTVVLRYSQALMLLIATTVVTLAASGLVDQAVREDIGAGRFVDGFPPRYLFLIALIYLVWAPLAARSVSAPLRMIERQTPGIGEYRDVYLDRQTTELESATVFATLIVLVASTVAMIASGHEASGRSGVTIGVVLSVIAVASWLLALKDYRASPRSTVRAVRLLIRGYDAPRPSAKLESLRADTTPPS